MTKRFLRLPRPNVTPVAHVPNVEAFFLDIECPASVVILGANGSGKTRLGTWLDAESSHNATTLRISAQKSLSMPESVTPVAVDLAERTLLMGHESAIPEQYASWKTSQRWGGKGAVHPLDDFHKLMVYLFSDQTEESAKYLAASLLTEDKVPPPNTRLQKLKVLWESILPHRELIIGGARLQTAVVGAVENPYSSSQMSDGERVIFYLIGECLSAPKDGVIVVDEPELHLHKSVQAPLWSAIEKLRDDCLFVYITHDVDFAAAQESATKLWLKSFDGAAWDWEIINDVDGLPEDLLLEVLGSRKPVLFVEGLNGRKDVALYRALFSDFLVMPRGSCSAVIDEVRALRANEKLHHLNVCGLIDRDRRPERELAKLEGDNIFALNVAEVENLFCTREVIEFCSKRLERNVYDDFAAAAKYAFNAVTEEFEKQVSMRTAAEIKFQLGMFEDSAQGAADLAASVDALAASIDVKKLYTENETLFQNVIDKGDYEALLKYYNRKSLSARIGKNVYGMAGDEFLDFVLRLAKSDAAPAIREAVKPYLGAFADRIAVAKRPVNDVVPAKPAIG